MVTSCVVEEVEPWEPVLMLEKNDSESQKPFFITYKDFEPLLSQALQNSSPYFRMEQDEWYTPFGRVERVDALSIKPTKLPNRISVLPITQDIPASDRAYFLNIYQNTKGKWITYVTEYLLEDGNSMSDVDMKSFTGRITQYSMDREILQELLIVNGSVTTLSNARTCGYTWDPYSYKICSGPVTGEEFCHDTFGYDLIPEPCDTSPHDPVQIDENPWQGGGGGSVPSPRVRKFELDITFLSNQKLMCAYNALNAQGGIQSIVSQFLGNSEFDVVMSVGKLSGENGKTIFRSNSPMQIIIDEGYISSAS